MSFGNAIAYTQSPGGVRRGLIWQSSNMGPRIDPRWHLFNPRQLINDYRIGTPQGNIALPNKGLPIAGASYYSAMTGKKLPIDLNRTPINCPEYPYITTTDVDGGGNTFITSYANERSFYQDLDFYIDPKMCNVGEASDLDNPSEWYRNGGGGPYLIRGARGQLQNSGTPYGAGYYEISPSDYEPTGTPTTMDHVYSDDRISYPSSPMRIKCRVVVSDYPFTLSPKFTNHQYGIVSQFNCDICGAYFDSILDAYTMPTAADFSGSKIETQDSGSYYDTFAIPVFSDISGTRKEDSSLNSSGATVRQYRKMSGLLNIAQEPTFQMLVSPVMYNYGPGQDWNVFLPSSYYETTAEKLTKMGKHADPYLLPPEIITPYVLNNPDPYSHVTTYSEQTGYNFTSGNYNTISSTGGYFYDGYGTTAEERASYISPYGVFRNYPTGITFPDLHFGYHIPDTPAVDRIREYPESYVQPIIQRGQKYIQEFRTSVAVFNAQRTSSGSDYYGVSGRYKYIGIKGCISWYETP